MVDVVVYQQHQDPSMMGPSLMDKTPLSRVGIAMINDVHFWGLRHSHVDVPLEPPQPQIVHRPIAADREESDDDSTNDLRAWYQETQESARPQMADTEVEEELRLCKCLQLWNPFARPSQELIIAMQELRRVDCQSRLGLRCLLRQAVVEQLQYEQDHLSTLPKRMLHNSAARYRLRRSKVMIPEWGTNLQLQGRANIIEHHQIPSVSKFADLLAEPCGKGHSCLNDFRQCPQSARNWRIMWRSCPPSSRREKLIEVVRKQLEDYRDGDDMREWRLEYSLMGVPVCKAAFMRITGISAWSLTQARRNVLRGHNSSLSRQELGLSRSIVSRNHPDLYIDARQWLEHYADTHGEHSPMDCLTFLPAGRKQFYYTQYSLIRSQQCRPAASLKTFQQAWRFDVSWLVISRTICKFSKCGVCEYLKWLIDQTPRTKRAVINTYVSRLGQHFDFHSAQRLVVARVEEACIQSGNTKWLMIIDKMDQNAAKLPTEWRLIRSAFFKEGDRLQVSLNGAWFFGPLKSSGVLIRTMYEDFQHGANMQASTFLMNFHNRVMQEGTVPEEWFINADNTTKETKNTISANFVIWLLLNVADTPLWSVTFLYQIVGHTHNKLDRCFGLIKHALQGSQG